MFYSKQLRKLAKGFFLWAQTLLASLSFIPFPQHDPLVHKCLFQNLTLGCVGEYFWAIQVLAPFSLAPTSSNTTLAFTTLHPKFDGHFSFFFEDYEPD
jgi:hypothetical protein